MEAYRLWSRGTLPAIVLLMALSSVNTARAQYGVYLNGAGAASRSMGGASTAAPLSAAGALYWNPASLSGLDRSELEIAPELLFVVRPATSTFQSSAFGAGIPPVTLSGSTDSNTGAYPL